MAECVQVPHAVDGTVERGRDGVPGDNLSRGLLRGGAERERGAGVVVAGELGAARLRRAVPEGEIRRDPLDRLAAENVQNLSFPRSREVSREIEKDVSGKEHGRLVGADYEGFHKLAAAKHIAAREGVQNTDVRNGARRGDRRRESNVLEVLDADTAVCLCGRGEINLDPLRSRIAYLRYRSPRPRRGR